jgi:hypothetical protein
MSTSSALSGTLDANLTCCGCGHDPTDTGADWGTCPSCGKVFCTACLDRRRSELLARGEDASTIFCACCGGGSINAAS